MTDISVIDPQNENAIFRLGFLPAFTQGRFHLSHKIGFVNDLDLYHWPIPCRIE